MNRLFLLETKEVQTLDHMINLTYYLIEDTHFKLAQSVDPSISFAICMTATRSSV